MHAILEPEVETTPAPREVPLHAIRHTFVFLGFSAAAGLVLAIIWSPGFVDQTLGENGATTILGYSVTLTPITSALMGIGSPSRRALLARSPRAMLPVSPPSRLYPRIGDRRWAGRFDRWAGLRWEPAS